MYQPHNLYWLLLPLLFFAVWFAVQCVRYQGKNRKKMIWPWLGALGVILLINVVSHYDDMKLLEELRGFHPAAINTLVLSQGNRRREINTPSEIAALISAFQSITNVAAHHSNPLNRFDVVFDYQYNAFHYQVGRDSEKPDEYWVIRITNGREELGPTVVHGRADGLEKLLEDSLNKSTNQANP